MIYNKTYVETQDDSQFEDRYKQVFDKLSTELKKHGYKMGYTKVVQNYRSVQVYQSVHKPDPSRPYYYGPLVHKVGIIFKPVNPKNTAAAQIEYSEETFVTSKQDRKSKNYVKSPEEMLTFILL